MIITRIATILLCTAAPVALLAQDVNLRSEDEFISLHGQIVGYNGVMVRVATTVGTVSVPASEVICHGNGCLEIIASNDFGLTAGAFQGVVADVVVADAADSVKATSESLQVAFAAPAFGALYTATANAFAATGAATSSDGRLTIQNSAGTEAVTLNVTDDATTADILIDTVSLNGTATGVFEGAADWAAAETLSQQLVGLQSFSVIVAPNAGINSISLNNLARIYAGEVTNWSQIGGADIKVLPLQLPTSSPLRAEMEALVMAPAGKTTAANVLTMSDEMGISASINQIPGSISVISTQAVNSAMTVSVAGSCGVAVNATPFNIKSGDYPLVRPIMATYTSAPAISLVTDLFDFAATDVAQNQLMGAGVISHQPSAQDGVEKNARLSQLLGASLDSAQRTAAAQMSLVLFDADRLWPTMTGGAASGPEGAWNRAMLQSVIAAMSDPANAGREIIFVGVGESTVGSQVAIDASVVAAAEIQAALEAAAAGVVAAGNFTLSSYGFGNVSAATCIDGQVVGSEYTRVETWIR
jgi:phosphate transport system substrate-binding protein